MASACSQDIMSFLEDVGNKISVQDLEVIRGIAHGSSFPPALLMSDRNGALMFVVSHRVILPQPQSVRSRSRMSRSKTLKSRCGACLSQCSTYKIMWEMGTTTTTRIQHTHPRMRIRNYFGKKRCLSKTCCSHMTRYVKDFAMVGCFQTL